MLTQSRVANAKPRSKSYKLADQGSLYIIISPKGGKSWKYDYRLHGVRKTYTIGSFPELSLSEAREAHLRARKLVHQGIHPLDDKQAQEASLQRHTERFSKYYYTWTSKQHFADSTLYTLNQSMETNLLDLLDKKPINEYSTLDLLKIFESIPSRETSRKLCGVVRRVLNEIMILGLIESNPAGNLAELLTKPDPKNKTNFAHLTDVGELRTYLQLLDEPAPKQSIVITQALKLMPHLFLRPKNLCTLKWQYVNTETREIILPASEMKTNKELIVPLSCQALEIVESMESITGSKEYLFTINKGKPICRGGLLDALNRLTQGKIKMTSHGFRHTASTILNELGYPADAIELQLGHSLGGVRGVYNKSQLMDERRKMMQDYSNYLDGLKSNNNVIPFRKLG